MKYIRKKATARKSMKDAKSDAFDRKDKNKWDRNPENKKRIVRPKK